MADNNTPLLQVDSLHITYGSGRRTMEAVKGVSFEIARGEAYGLIGESGSGKTSVAFSILKYIRGGRISGGRILFDGRDMAGIEGQDLAAIRGKAISIVYQDPMSALNPLLKVGEQVAESIRRHSGADREAARKRTLALFQEVNLPSPEEALTRYPHQLSGGQQQRVVIAMALACNPELLIMDEPTTGLDVTTEAVILELIAELRRRHKLSILFISHNLAVVAKVCDRVGVLYQGNMVEEGPIDSVMVRPKADYTRTLISAAPRIARPGERSSRPPLGDTVLRVEGLNKTYHGRKGLFSRHSIHQVRALDNVSFSLRGGETLAVVGESGSGKSTLARVISGITSLDSGKLVFEDSAMAIAVEQRERRQKREVQIIFQNPDSSLNPLQTIAQIIARPLQLYGLCHGSRAIRARVRELMESVKLEARMEDLYPWQLSGGQKQRVSVARAFAAEPKLIICDEPTSALDISVQARLLEQLRILQEQSGTSYLFISHDLGTVNSIAHRVMVMQHGRVVETGDVDSIFTSPREAYTRTLMDAMPVLQPLEYTSEREI